MRREEIFDAYFEAEFCAAADKVSKIQTYEEKLATICATSGKPRDVIELAILRRYPGYRAIRLARELPSIPPSVRSQ